MPLRQQKTSAVIVKPFFSPRVFAARKAKIVKTTATAKKTIVKPLSLRKDALDDWKREIREIAKAHPPRAFRRSLGFGLTSRLRGSVIGLRVPQLGQKALLNLVLHFGHIIAVLLKCLIMKVTPDLFRQCARGTAVVLDLHVHRILRLKDHSMQ